MSVGYLSDINRAWGWTGLIADEIVGLNEFGNFLVKDVNGCFWRICPEELFCRVVAKNSHEFSQLVNSENFKADWEMENLVTLARQHVGSLKGGWVYYMVIPATFGGPYEATNIRSVPLGELIDFAGDWARETDNLPDGAQIEMRVI